MVSTVTGPGFDRFGRLNLRARLVREVFRHSVGTAPASHGEALAATQMIMDMDYGSSLPGGTLDLHFPRKAAGPIPLVLLVHGGAFIGGDKLDNRIYAIELAARGWAVANINYLHAPEARYPSPLIQIDEAYRFLAARAQEFGLDLERLFLAGDSAGAHMIAQYAAIQTDPAYASSMNFIGSVPPASIRGILLFCGPYDLGLLKKARGGPLVHIGFYFLGSVYFGRKDWLGSRESTQASLIAQLGRGFPPTFITDGNSWSFEEHGRALAAKLRASGVPVTEFFHDRKKVCLRHQYHYILDSVAGWEAFEAVLEFLSSPLSRGEKNGKKES